MANTTKLKREYIFAVGRRKGRVGRVCLYYLKSFMWGEMEIKQGEIAVNQIAVEKYFSGDVAKVIYTEPFKVTNTLGKYIVTAKIVGGGTRSQLEAFVHGVARALNNVNNNEHRSSLKTHGLLTRDARVRQRRTIGTGGKSRRQKQSP